MNNKQKQPPKSEYSSGGIVFRPSASGKGWEIVAIQRARHNDWSLPKGHIEAGETRQQAALREVKEETNLEGRILFSLGEIQYYFRKPNGDLIHKFVHYYLMEPTSDDLLDKPNSEVSEARWVSINEARNLLSYEKDKQIVTKALVELRVRFPENDDRKLTNDESR